MDAPKLVLRFRDALDKIDTIEEHKKILESMSAVWWGWWKKSVEDHLTEKTGALIGNNGGVLLIIDTQTERLFRCSFLRVCVNSSDVDTSRVPKYYRSESDKVSGWFLLNSIDEIEYDNSLAVAVGERTFLPLDGEKTELPRQTEPSIECSGDKILHLSDLHFGADHGFLAPTAKPELGANRYTLVDCLLADLKSQGLLSRVGLVLVTGDFTSRGDWSDSTRREILKAFDELRASLNLVQNKIIAVPGNHDIVRYGDDIDIDANAMALEDQIAYEHQRPYANFLEELTGRHWRQPFTYATRYKFGQANFDIASLDSCKITATNWTEYGFVSAEGPRAITNLSSMPLDAPTYRTIALHHHLVPVQPVETPDKRGVSLTLNAADILDNAQEAGVGIAFHGHQHRPRIARYGNPIISENLVTVVAAGSAGVKYERRFDERNSYGIISVGAKKCELEVRDIRADKGKSTTIHRAELAQPLQPTT